MLISQLWLLQDLTEAKNEQATDTMNKTLIQKVMKKLQEAYFLNEHRSCGQNGFMGTIDQNSKHSEVIYVGFGYIEIANAMYRLLIVQR